MNAILTPAVIVPLHHDHYKKKPPNQAAFFIINYIHPAEILSQQNVKFRFFIEDVDFVHVDGQSRLAAFTGSGTSIYTRNYSVIAKTAQVEEHFMTKVFRNINHRSEDCVREASRNTGSS